MVELQEDRSRAALKFAPELQHHLAGPVVALDKALATVVGGVAAERPRHIGAGRAVIVLDQRVDLKAFEVGELGAGVKGHGVAVTGICRILVGAEQVARGRKPEAAGGAASEDHRLGAHDQEFAIAGVDADCARHASIRSLQQAGRHVAIGDGDLQATQLPVQDLLDVMSLGHGQHICAHMVNLADVEFAGTVLFELDPELIEKTDHRVAALGISHDGLLVNDAVVGDCDLLDVLLGRGVAGNDGVVQSVHAHADGAAALDVRLLHENDTQAGILLFGFDRRHRAAGAPA